MYLLSTNYKRPLGKPQDWKNQEEILYHIILALEQKEYHKSIVLYNVGFQSYKILFETIYKFITDDLEIDSENFILQEKSELMPSRDWVNPNLILTNQGLF